ncbi:MAG: hypothetical protein AUK44_07530 [Porphyromonadaceae bacterium CG2_30_38_12]|nr:MAG: hypothetical protein AUK44_07530 [Porphyromonadaceae bacterium CG2_30_38_12]
MKKTIVLFLLFLSFQLISSQEISFSDSTQISLITCTPGPEVYAKFGHTGIRVFDRKTGLDLIFNYGMFSFNTENFYFKFIKGETDYSLGVQYTADFLPEYQRRNSTVWENTLNLNSYERKRLISLLIDNYKEENRVYRYNFVYDNCATRPRDKVLSCVEGHVIFQDFYVNKTYRQAIDEYLGNDTWIRFSIDLVFGYQADKQMPQMQSMFLPEMLKYEFLNAKIMNITSKQSKPLIANTNMIVNSTVKIAEKPSFFSKPFDVFVSLLVFILLISILELSFHFQHNTIMDSILLILTGIGGLIVFFLMLFSIHPLVKYNFNIFWLNPVNIFVGILIWFKRFRVYVFIYQIFNILLLILALVSVAISLQTFNQATFVVIALLFIRYSVWVYRTKKRIVRKMKFEIKD